jgi:hypothetical protein
MRFRCCLALLMLSPLSHGQDLSTDPLLSLEHGLWLQEIKAQPAAALQIYTQILKSPQASARVQTEARFHAAECYELRDCPRAALALYQIVARGAGDSQPFAKVAAGRLPEVLVQLEDEPCFPCRHTLSHLGDQLLLLRSALMRGDASTSQSLVQQMRDNFAVIREELALVPTNEPITRATARAAAGEALQGQLAALDTISSSLVAAKADVAIRMAGSDASLQALLRHQTLYPTRPDWAGIVAAKRELWLRAVLQGDPSRFASAAVDLQAALKPVVRGAKGNPIVLNAEALLQTIADVTAAIARGKKQPSELILAEALHRLYQEHTPAANVRLRSADDVPPALVSAYVSVLTFVDEALHSARNTLRREHVTALLDSGLLAAQQQMADWAAQPAAQARLQRLIDTMRRAREEAQQDLAASARTLKTEAAH